MERPEEGNVPVSRPAVRHTRVAHVLTLEWCFPTRRPRPTTERAIALNLSDVPSQFRVVVVQTEFLWSGVSTADDVLRVLCSGRRCGPLLTFRGPHLRSEPWDEFARLRTVISERLGWVGATGSKTSPHYEHNFPAAMHCRSPSHFCCLAL